MKIVSVNKLQVGMILGENIYRDEQLVISEDVTLNIRHISMMESMGVDRIKINFTAQANKTIEKPLFKIDLADRYKNSVEKFKEICYSVSIGNHIIYDDVKECIDPLIDQVNGNPQMAMRLWQMEMSDFYTYEHSVKVCVLTVLLSKWLNKSELYISDIGRAGLLHDIGKCNIPNEILNKPDMLTEEEFSVMKTHSTLGYVLLSVTKGVNSSVLKGILQHHEKYDGTGYPAKLSGDEIHEYARVISVVDMFDAMTSNRVYRQKMNPFRVMEIISNGADGSLDPNILNVFLNRIKHLYVGSKIILANGDVAEIVSADTPLAYRPIIKLENRIIDLSTNFDIEIRELIIE